VNVLDSSCFFQMRRLRQIRNHVNRRVMKQLVRAFVISRLDYCNSILAGLPKCLLSQLQRVQNAILFELHWLPVHLNIEYRMYLLMHSATVRCCPSYIRDLVQTTAASSCRQGPRSFAATLKCTVRPTNPYWVEGAGVLCRQPYRLERIIALYI